MRRVVPALLGLLLALPAAAAPDAPVPGVPVPGVPALGMPAPGAPVPDPGLTVSLSSWLPGQGDAVFVRCSLAPAPDNVVVVWKGNEVPMREEGPGRYVGLVGVDLLDPPGKIPLSVVAVRGGSRSRFDLELTVAARSFPVQELSLPTEMAEFDAPTLARIEEERLRLDALFSRPTQPVLWETPFAPPVADYRPQGFGARRVINGEARSPHAGVDVRLPEGLPVTAIAGGTVVLAEEQFFGGRAVVIDHGGGLYSIYFHMSEYAVAAGQRVARGERIGTIGATGRATGPHLHFSVRAAGGRIDPAGLFADTAR